MSNTDQNHNTRKKLVIGNWKLHGNLVSNADLLNSLKTTLTKQNIVDVGVCVPFPYLHQAQSLLAGSGITHGAQDLSMHANGAFTGEVSAAMLADFACTWVLCGHSERRIIHSETSDQAALKVKSALSAGITPVICVGETIDQRQSGQVEQIISDQLKPVLLLQGVDLNNIVIAYEPVWAIGTGHTATPEQAQQIHAFIRSELKPLGLDAIQILYGGSVKPENAASLFNQPDIDGALVGGASLDADSFAAIVAAAKL